MIPNPLFYIIFLIDDVLELGDLASGAYYTYDAYQMGYKPESLHAGCEDDDFALITINDSHCTDVVAAAPLVQCNSSDVRAYSYCSLTSTTAEDCEIYAEDFEVNCGFNLEIYQAVPQDCQQYFTLPCAKIKQFLCIASAVGMLVSICCSSCCHGLLMITQIMPDSEVDNDSMAWLAFLFVMACMGALGFWGFIMVKYMLADFRDDGDSVPSLTTVVLAFIVVSYAGGFLLTGVLCVVACIAGVRDGGEWIFKSALMQVPAASFLAAFVTPPDVAKELHEKRQLYKFCLRVGQDIPDLIIATIDMVNHW
eukprot:869302-Amphidinium_carterae.2